MAVDLDAIEAALAKMTAGPWPEVNARSEPIVWHEMDGDGWTAIGPVHSDDDDNVTGGPAYIQAARDSLGLRTLRNAAPALLAALRAARQGEANARAVAVEAVALLDARLNPRTLEGYVFKSEAEAQLAAIRASLDASDFAARATAAIDRLVEVAASEFPGSTKVGAARAEALAVIGVGRG